MSLKRRFKAQLNEFSNSLDNLRLPTYLSGKAARIVLSLVVVFCGVGYIFQVSSTAVSGYEINSLQNQSDDLKKEIQKLQVEIADYSSLNSVQVRAKNLGMVAVGDIKYKTIESNVAMAQ